jgi:hypothetical protein
MMMMMMMMMTQWAIWLDSLEKSKSPNRALTTILGRRSVIKAT